MKFTDENGEVYDSVTQAFNTITNKQEPDAYFIRKVSPAKPDVLVDGARELERMFAGFQNESADVARHTFTAAVNAALKLMRLELETLRHDAQTDHDLLADKIKFLTERFDLYEKRVKIDKLEARIAELEAAKIWPVAPGPYSFAGNCPRCHQPPGVCQCPSVTVTGAIAGLTVGENVVPLTVGEKK